MPDDYIGNDLERAAVRGESAHDLGRWLRSIARIEGPVRGASNWNRDAMLAGALDAVEQFYAGEPDEAIREVVIATSLVLWLDRNVHVVADLLAASIAEQVRARRRTPVENLLAPLLDAGRYVDSTRGVDVAAVSSTESPAGGPPPGRRRAEGAARPMAAFATPTPTDADQERFADAQARLDEGDYPTGEAGRAQEAEDRRFADWYDQAVNGAAQDEFERQCDEAEFRSHYPEPADGARIEWEGSDGVMRAAARIDYSGEPGNWWVHGQTGAARTWRQLVVEYQIPDGLADVTSLTEVGQPTADAAADTSTQGLIVKLGVLVDGEHEGWYDGCNPAPGVHCYSWCKACAVLAAVPDNLMAQIRALRNP